MLRKNLSSIGTAFLLISFIFNLVDPFHFRATSPRMWGLLMLGSLVLGVVCWVSAGIMKIKSGTRKAEEASSSGNNGSLQGSRPIDHFRKAGGCIVFALILFFVVNWQLRTNTLRNWVTFEYLFIGGGILAGAMESIKALLKIVKTYRLKG